MLSKWRPISFAGIMAVVGLLFLLAYRNDKATSTAAPPLAKQRTDEPKENDLIAPKIAIKTVSDDQNHQTLTIDGLLSDYGRNEISADAYYKGTRLNFINFRPPAQIETIGRDITGKPYITFRSRSGWRSVQAFFSSDAAVARLQAGDDVTFIDGICDGLMGNVILEDSHITGTVFRPRR